MFTGKLLSYFLFYFLLETRTINDWIFKWPRQYWNSNLSLRHGWTGSIDFNNKFLWAKINPTIEGKTLLRHVNQGLQNNRQKDAGKVKAFNAGWGVCTTVNDSEVLNFLESFRSLTGITHTCLLFHVIMQLLLYKTKSIYQYWNAKRKKVNNQCSTFRSHNHSCWLIRLFHFYITSVFYISYITGAWFGEAAQLEWHFYEYRPGQIKLVFISLLKFSPVR